MPAALDDITVLDLSTMLPGQTCSMVLGDLGARVITIERPGAGHFARHRGWPGSFESVNRNKESLTLDLTRPEADDIVGALIQRADVVLEGFRPGVADRLGVGYDRIAAKKAEIIYCSISGYGQTGSYRGLPGHDVNYLAMSGALSLAGPADGPPSADIGVSMADLASGWFAAIAIIAALRARDRYGVGQYVDVAMADAAFALIQNRIGERLADPRLDKFAQMSRPANGLFETGDALYLAVAAIEDHFWQSLCELVGAGDLADDPALLTTAQRRAHSARIRERLARAFLTRPRDQWLQLLRDRDIPCAPVLDVREAFESAYATERELGWVAPVAEPHAESTVRFPPRLSVTPATIRLRAPTLGEHTETLLRELGLSDDQVAELHASGVV